jgi:hypothetical protein
MESHDEEVEKARDRSASRESFRSKTSNRSMTFIDTISKRSPRKKVSKIFEKNITVYHNSDDNKIRKIRAILSDMRDHLGKSALVEKESPKPKVDGTKSLMAPGSKFTLMEKPNIL